MKLVRLSAQALVAIFLLAVLAGPLLADNQISNNQSDFQSSSSWKKVSPGLQQAWQEYLKTGDSSQRLECFAVMRAGANEGDQDFLLDAGFAVQVPAGLTWKGRMYIKDLPRVASQAMLKQVRLVTE